jgi:hypothetical protein
MDALLPSAWFHFTDPVRTPDILLAVDCPPAFLMAGAESSGAITALADRLAVGAAISRASAASAGLMLLVSADPGPRPTPSAPMACTGLKPASPAPACPA